MNCQYNYNWVDFNKFYRYYKYKRQALWGMGIVVKKFIVILGFVLALTFLQNVKFEINCLAEEDGMIDWHSYELEDLM